MPEYRGIEITCETVGSFAGGGTPTPIERCRAKIKNLPLIGTLEEVKKKIDDELDRKQNFPE